MLYFDFIFSNIKKILICITTIVIISLYLWGNYNYNRRKSLQIENENLKISQKIQNDIILLNDENISKNNQMMKKYKQKIENVKKTKNITEKEFLSQSKSIFLYKYDKSN